jgi:hypothetical protein
MLDVRKYETSVETQQHGWMISTNSESLQHCFTFSPKKMGQLTVAFIFL